MLKKMCTQIFQVVNLMAYHDQNTAPNMQLKGTHNNKRPSPKE